jgi:hypothetical protein
VRKLEARTGGRARLESRRLMAEVGI